MVEMLITILCQTRKNPAKHDSPQHHNTEMELI